jgi:hypothetical protein
VLAATGFMWTLPLSPLTGTETTTLSTTPPRLDAPVGHLRHAGRHPLVLHAGHFQLLDVQQPDLGRLEVVARRHQPTRRDGGAGVGDLAQDLVPSLGHDHAVLDVRRGVGPLGRAVALTPAAGTVPSAA